MTSLIYMRLRGYALTGRALAPILASLVVLGVIYGGGQAQAGEAYGFSAAVLLPVVAWQTKMLLDAEPDTQRRLAMIAVGGAVKELGCGLIAAIAAAIPIVVIALGIPWVFNGIAGPRSPDDLSLGAGVALGVWAHLILIFPAVAIGALASRAVTRTAGRGVAVLAVLGVGVFVVGSTGSPIAWLAPPALAATRYSSTGGSLVVLGLITVWALIWTAIAIVGYGGLRRVLR